MSSEKTALESIPSLSGTASAEVWNGKGYPVGSEAIRACGAAGSVWNSNVANCESVLFEFACLFLCFFVLDDSLPHNPWLASELL